MEKGKGFPPRIGSLADLLAIEKAKEARRCALIEWLAAPDVSAALLSAQNQREEGTGTWFLESKEFLEWINAGQSMWLAGDGMYSIHD